MAMWLQPVDYVDEQYSYFAALGRAVALAQNFEQNCKFVFGTSDLGRAYSEGKFSIDDWQRYAKELQKRSLGVALKAQQKDGLFSSQEIAALEAAREARNYLVHEAAEGGLYVAPKSGKPGKTRKLLAILQGQVDTAAIEKERAEMLLAHLSKAVLKFEEAVQALAQADSMVAGWSYLIQEKEDRLPLAAAGYADMAIAWVLEPLRIAGLAAGPRS